MISHNPKEALFLRLYPVGFLHILVFIFRLDFYLLMQLPIESSYHGFIKIVISVMFVDGNIFKNTLKKGTRRDFLTATKRYISPCHNITP